MSDLNENDSAPRSRSGIGPSKLEQPLVAYIDVAEPLMHLYEVASRPASHTSSVQSSPPGDDQSLETADFAPAENAFADNAPADNAPADDATESVAEFSPKSTSMLIKSRLALKMSQAAQSSSPASQRANWRSAIAILAISLGAFCAGGIATFLVQTNLNKEPAPVTTQAAITQQPATTQAPAATQSPNAAQALARAQAAIATVPSKADLLFWPELLRPGAVSPRGKSAADITADEAFRIANAKIHGLDGEADTDEARFWLRVGVAETLSGGQLSWALTQLGTLYARPQASPSDFAIARGVWEVAAAARDPVALCFLAMLEEGGFGTAPNREVALTLYRQAQEAGACERAGPAIERLSR